MSKVFVINTDKQPLNPIHSAQARQLLRNGKAAVFRRFPFTIILKESRPIKFMSKNTLFMATLTVEITSLVRLDIKN
jgi:hypothetical protein